MEQYVLHSVEFVEVTVVWCIIQAWDDTFRNWGVVTQYLEAYPKDHKMKIEDTATVGDPIRVKRKPPHHANTEHELEVGCYGNIDDTNKELIVTMKICSL